MELYWAGKKEKFIAHHAGHYDNDPDYQLPEPKPLMTAVFRANKGIENGA